MRKQTELVQGTLDMLILKAVSLGGLHGYGVLLRLEQLTGGQLQIQQGSLYPALYRLEQQGLIASEWGESENKRKAKFYSLTAAGRKQLKAEEASWNRFSAVVASVLGRAAGGVVKIFRRKNFESDMDTELRFHIASYIDDLVAFRCGTHEAERRAAGVRTVEATKDDCRQAWGLQRMDEICAPTCAWRLRAFRTQPGIRGGGGFSRWRSASAPTRRSSG